MKSLFFSLWKFAEFLMSFLKAQVSFPLNCASIFSAIKHNSSVLFLAQTLYTLFKKFWDFLVLESKFGKCLMSILKRQVNSSSNFALFFIAMTHNSSLNFKLIHFLLCMKRSPQNPNLETFKCFGENLPTFLMSFSKPQVSFSSNFSWLFSVMKDNSSALF